ncbi:MAG: hypothetical protein M0Z54_01850 [Thermaerobacter sp.]|nr:hypothetical protein [Thermaerobacter sp.]
MLWTGGAAAATLVGWGLWTWGRVVAVRFQWIGTNTAWRATVSVAGARGRERLATGLAIPALPTRHRASGGGGAVRGSGWMALNAAGVVLARRTPAGRLWTRGRLACGSAAASAVAVGATEAVLGWWYGARLVPIAVQYLRVRWEADPLADGFAWQGRIGGMFRFRLGDIMQAILVGLWVLRRSPKQEASAHGQP